MEYNLQKTIENSFMTPMLGQSGQSLTTTPAIDFVNPGIGCEINQFSFYVPLNSTKEIHTIEKVTDNEQEGLGFSEAEDNSNE
jgi:hypothetical protein